MDNVLIDDRRIHVDFSQSVAKVQMQKQGNFSLNRLPFSEMAILECENATMQS